MPTDQGFLAFDLGAESGRAMIVRFDGQTASLEEAHRFPNRLVELPSGTHWNTTGLWLELVEGLGKATDLAKQTDTPIVALGVDTWGVDFGLIGGQGELLGLPHAYRDARNAPAMQRAIDRIGEAALYAGSGIQLLNFNTLFQVEAQQHAEPRSLELAERLLFMPDLLHYFFSGEQANELTIASTSAMLKPDATSWASDLLDRLALPHHFLKDVIPAGSRIGTLRPALAEAAGLGDAPAVVAPGSHDTASAIAAVPLSPEHAATGDWAYLSSGTWSLLGMELDEPIVTDAARAAGFTNERGVGGKVRFLTNIAGLWLVQQVRAGFAAAGQTLSYAELTEQAEASEPFRTLIDPNHASFAAPGGSLEKLKAFGDATGQPAPETPGQCVRCCLETLALEYAHALQAVEAVTGRHAVVLHIVGGGGQNGLLNRMTANAIHRPVVVGPFEATALGNGLTQAIGTGALAGLDELRAVVRHSFELETVEPDPTDPTDPTTGPEAFAAQADRYAALRGAGP
ncbi:MAG: rhamnulokinase family protein [Planctomycetota bacterium]